MTFDGKPVTADCGTGRDVVAADAYAGRSTLGVKGFGRYWAAFAISEAGSAVSAVVIPLIAATELHVSPIQMSALFGIGLLAPLLLQLPVSMRADLSAHRVGVMVAMDFTSAGVLGVIPWFWALGRLSYTALLGVSGLLAVLGVVRSAYSQPVVFSLLPPQRIVGGIGLLNSTRSGAEIAGKGLAGSLLAVLSAPTAVLADATSFIVSGLLCQRLPVEKAREDKGGPGQTCVSRPLGALIDMLVRRSDLWLLMSVSVINGVTESVLILYSVRVLGIPNAELAVLFSAGAIGGVIGGIVVGRLNRRLTPKSVVFVGCALTLASLIPLVIASASWGAPVALVVFEFAGSLGGVVLVATVLGSLQMEVGEGAVARTMALANNALQVATLVGVAVGGFIAQRTTLRTSVEVSTALAVAVLIGSLAAPKMRSDETADQHYHRKGEAHA